MVDNERKKNSWIYNLVGCNHNIICHGLFEKIMAEMPYGVAKAKTGDPYEWFQNWIANHGLSKQY